jgi:hypothetical protein
MRLHAKRILLALRANPTPLVVSFIAMNRQPIIMVLKLFIVHLVRITPEQATELVNLAIMTQDHELADFARYCQSVAATTQIGIEPSPGKIQEELAKGRQELSQQGRVHTGPGYGAAFASVGRSAPAAAAPAQIAPATTAAPAPASGMQLTMDMVAHLQRIADRTGDKVLHDTARKAHSACAKSLSEAPGVHLVSISPDHASELVNLAIRTQDHELANFARYCQSVAATNQIGIEPAPGKIAEEIAKGRQELQQQGRARIILSPFTSHLSPLTSHLSPLSSLSTLSFSPPWKFDLERYWSWIWCSVCVYLALQFLPEFRPHLSQRFPYKCS